MLKFNDKEITCAELWEYVRSRKEDLRPHANLARKAGFCVTAVYQAFKKAKLMNFQMFLAFASALNITIRIENSDKSKKKQTDLLNANLKDFRTFATAIRDCVIFESTICKFIEKHNLNNSVVFDFFNHTRFSSLDYVMKMLTALGFSISLTTEDYERF